MFSSSGNSAPAVPLGIGIIVLKAEDIAQVGGAQE